MKKVIALISLLFALFIFLVACSNNTSIKIEVDAKSPFEVNENIISASLYNSDNIDVFSYISFSKGEYTLYKDSFLTKKMDLGNISLNEGENKYYIVVEYEGKKVNYELKIFNHIIKELNIEKLYEKIYPRDSLFDKHSIELYGTKANGEKVKIENYDLEYDFSSDGNKTVVFSIPKVVAKFECTVHGEYIPDITDNMTSKENIIYTIEDGYAYILSGENFEGDLICYDLVIYNNERISVKGIKEYAFSRNKKINSVTCLYPYQVGEGAFDNSSLKEATFKYGTFGSFAFAECKELEAVVLPDDLAIIPNSMFSNCVKLKGINFSEKLESIGAQAFHNCYSIENIVFPKSLKSIGARAFKRCESLETISCDIGVSFIGEEAFSYCTKLKVLLVPALDNFTDGSIVKGDDNVVVYTGESTPLLFFLKKNNIKNEALKNNSIFVINNKETYNIGEEFDYNQISVLVYCDDEIRICDNFGYKSNFSIPGATKVEINYKGYTKQINVYVEYTLELEDNISDRGELFKIDEENKSAYLLSLPEKFDFYSYEEYGTYILPTSILRGGERYEVKGVLSNAINGKDYIKRLYIGSDIKLIEDNAICDCENLELLYIGVPSGKMLEIGEGNFNGFKDGSIIMCTLNNSVMHIYVRRYDLVFCGNISDKLYVNSLRGAKTKYEPGDVLVIDKYYAIYVDFDLIPHNIDLEDLTIKYDFNNTNVITFEYNGNICEYKVSLSQ